MPTHNDEIAFWSRIAPTYDRDNPYIVGEQLNQEIKTWLVSRLQPMDVILELGCGTGLFTEAMAPQVQQLTATDASEPMLRLAEQRLSGYRHVKLQIEDAGGTSFAAGTFDAVVMINLLHIVSNPLAVLQESQRVLKPGGRLFAASGTLTGASLAAKLGMVIRYFQRWGLPSGSRGSLSQADFERLARQAGFEVAEVALIGQHTKTVCLAGKKNAGLGAIR